MNERERERDEPIKKGVALAPIGSDVIWDDPKLKVPFSSNPFISRMKGSAVLDMVLSFGLYYNELTKKWTPNICDNDRIISKRSVLCCCSR